MTQPSPSAGHTAWQGHPERSSHFMLRVMTWISLRLGRRISRIVLYGIATYFLVFSPGARTASRHYLWRALKLSTPAAVSWRQLFCHFLSFASTIHDRVYLLNDRFDLFDIRIHNQALIDKVVADGQGVFLVGAHMGSFEVLRALGRKQPGLRVAMVMYEENARKINAALSAINPRAQQDIIALGHIDSMLHVHEQLANGTVVGMLADRSLGDDSTRPVNFLGAEAQLPIGPFRMAAILKRPVIFMTGLYLGRNRYDIYFETLVDFSALPRNSRAQALEDCMTRYALLLQRYCEQAPYNWFNFFDFWRAPVLEEKTMPRASQASPTTPKTP